MAMGWKGPEHGCGAGRSMGVALGWGGHWISGVDGDVTNLWGRQVQVLAMWWMGEPHGYGAGRLMTWLWRRQGHSMDPEPSRLCGLPCNVPPSPHLPTPLGPLQHFQPIRSPGALTSSVTRRISRQRVQLWTLLQQLWQPGSTHGCSHLWRLVVAPWGAAAPRQCPVHPGGVGSGRGRPWQHGRWLCGAWLCLPLASECDGSTATPTCPACPCAACVLGVPGTFAFCTKF